MATVDLYEHYCILKEDEKKYFIINFLTKKDKI